MYFGRKIQNFWLFLIGKYYKKVFCSVCINITAFAMLWEVLETETKSFLKVIKGQIKKIILQSKQSFRKLYFKKSDR